jgi:hypothetical protein
MNAFDDKSLGIPRGMSRIWMDSAKRTLFLFVPSTAGSVDQGFTNLDDIRPVLDNSLYDTYTKSEEGETLVDGDPVKHQNLFDFRGFS